MQKLVRGIQEFQRQLFAAERELFQRLAGGQKPDAMLITCSDSRIDPNLVTQTAPGELFVLRNAGNFVPPHSSAGSGEEATVEFALVGLGIRHVIVCGHSHCGAVKALLAPDTVRDSMPALCSWLNCAQDVRRIVQEKYGRLSKEELLNIAIQENVLVQLENLRTLPAVARALEKGELSLYGWVYKFETGQVFGYDPNWGQFVELNQDAAPLAATPPKRAGAQLNVI